jgi:hypothetical protein
MKLLFGNFLHYPVSFYLLDPKTFLSTLLDNVFRRMWETKFQTQTKQQAPLWISYMHE